MSWKERALKAAWKAIDGKLPISCMFKSEEVSVVAGYLAGIEDAAKIAEGLTIEEDEENEKNENRRIHNGVCIECAAEIRASVRVTRDRQRHQSHPLRGGETV